jgi:hypothetical protein
MQDPIRSKSYILKTLYHYLVKMVGVHCHIPVASVSDFICQNIFMLYRGKRLVCALVVFNLLEGMPGINLSFARKLLHTIDLVVLNIFKIHVLA